METAHTLTTADGATLAYRRWHRRHGPALPPLVLVHGVASNMTRWSEFVETTALKHSRDIIRLDLRGHGQSLYRGRIGLEIWADDIAAILNREGVAEAVVGGHCLGANVAVQFASRHRHQTAGLVLVEPMVRAALTGSLHRLMPFTPLLRYASGVIRLFNRLGLYRRHIETLDLQVLDREFRARLTQAGGGAALVKRYASPWHDLQIMPAANFLQDLVEVVRPLPLEKIRAPFLALLSTGRTFADPDATGAALATLTDGTLQTLAARHWIPTEQPDAMRHAIEHWCESLAARSGTTHDPGGATRADP
jgi:pimeloyl-ACP methyl ester carboxylesterase